MTEPLRIAGVSEEEALHALDYLYGDYGRPASADLRRWQRFTQLRGVIEAAYLLLSRPGVLEATGLCASKGDAPSVGTGAHSRSAPEGV